MMIMKKRTKLTDDIRAILSLIEKECNEDGKSTEFMIQYMQDIVNVTHDVVMDYLRERSEEE